MIYGRGFSPGFEKAFRYFGLVGGIIVLGRRDYWLFSKNALRFAIDEKRFSDEVVLLFWVLALTFLSF